MALDCFFLFFSFSKDMCHVAFFLVVMDLGLEGVGKNVNMSF